MSASVFVLNADDKAACTIAQIGRVRFDTEEMKLIARMHDDFTRLEDSHGGATGQFLELALSEGGEQTDFRFQEGDL